MPSELVELSNRTDLWALGLHLFELQKDVNVLSGLRLEKEIKLLANKMKREIPADVLATCHVVMIPRGGLFVGAELSYLLNFKPEQFVDDGRSDICVIDDCSLTGKRFAETLRRFEGRQVWFCHLASAKELRDNILKKEYEVQACLAAFDLNLRQDDSVKEMVDSERYLNKPIQHIAFPWTEPGLPVVLPFSGQMEDGWHLLPPHTTKGNLAALTLPLVACITDFDIEVPRGVIWRLIGDQAILFEPEAQRVIELNGDTLQIWKLCAGLRNMQAVVAESNLQGADVLEIIDKLLAKRLLVQI